MEINKLTRKELEYELKSRCVYCNKTIKLKSNFTAYKGEYYHFVYTDDMEAIWIYANKQLTAAYVEMKDINNNFTIGA